MQNTEPVAILLSTHNGSAYLSEQLDSLVAQSHRDWQIYWRDDGSADETCDMMRGFAETAGVGRVVDLNDNAGRIGITASFMSLLRRAPRGRIVAFADQDDVWLPNKLARGVDGLACIRPTQPGLYCARQHLVDAALGPIKLSPLITGELSFPRSMTQNVATGCTVMLNAEAAGLLADAEAPRETIHDWWSYLLVTGAGGKVVADNEPTVLYRQHENNAVGAQLSAGRRAFAALRRGPHVFMRSFRSHIDALEAQQDLLTPDARVALRLMSEGLHDGWTRRVRALAHPGMTRQNWVETQFFRLWFMLG